MAYITYRVSGVVDGRRVSHRFRNTPDGRQAAERFAKESKDSRRFYDARTRIGDGSTERSVTKTCRTRKEADDWVATTEADKLRGTALDPRRSSKRFDEYAATWLETRRVRGRPLAPKTSELYGVLMRVHILPAFEAMSLAEITSERVRAWHANFTSPMTAAKSYRLLRAIMSTAVTDGRILASPCAIRGGGEERSPERPTVGPETILALAEEIGDRFRCVVLLAGFGGLRIGEILALRRRHVDLERGTVAVVEQVVTLAGGRRLVTDPKTEAGLRKVHLSRLVVDALTDHLSTAVGAPGDALLFPATSGDLLPATTFYKAWRPARDAVGHPGLHLHDLRHAAGTLAAWTGATQKELMARLGHSSPAAAMRYQHAAADRDQAIASGLDTIIAALADSRRAIETR